MDAGRVQINLRTPVVVRAAHTRTLLITSMATSPLPRWAPTPSPSRPLCRSSDDGGRRGNVGDLLRSPFTAVVAALRGHHDATSGDDTAPSTDTAPPEQQHTAGGGELDGVDDGSGRRRERLDDGVFLTWEDV